MLVGLNKVEIPFPTHLYGANISESLLPAVGYACNILEIVCEMLLNASVVGDSGENFGKCFKMIRDERSGERVVEDLCSSEWYKTTEAKVKQIPGIKSDVVLLGLILSYDAASVNLKTGSTATPLYVSIGNVSPGDACRSSENVSFVGFFPKHAVRNVKQHCFNCTINVVNRSTRTTN